MTFLLLLPLLHHKAAILRSSLPVGVISVACYNSAFISTYLPLTTASDNDERRPGRQTRTQPSKAKVAETLRNVRWRVVFLSSAGSAFTPHVPTTMVYVFLMTRDVKGVRATVNPLRAAHCAGLIPQDMKLFFFSRTLLKRCTFIKRWKHTRRDAFFEVVD